MAHLERWMESMNTKRAKQLVVGGMEQRSKNELYRGAEHRYNRIVGRRYGGSPGLTTERRTTIRWRRRPAAKFVFLLAGGCTVRLGGSTPVRAHLGGNRKEDFSTAAGRALRAESIPSRLSGGIQPVARPQLAACGGRRCHAGSYFSAPAVRLRACCRRASD